MSTLQFSLGSNLSLNSIFCQFQSNLWSWFRVFGTFHIFENYRKTWIYFAVLEATDADNLLEQFEDAVSEAVSEDFTEEGNDNEDMESESKTSNPKKTSNIYKAVQNHFAASAASSSTGGGKDNPTRRLPRIGKPAFKVVNSMCFISRFFALAL